MSLSSALYIIVHRSLVKEIKIILETRKQLNKRMKISEVHDEETLRYLIITANFRMTDGLCMIPTTETYQCTENEGFQQLSCASKTAIARQLGLDKHTDNLSLALFSPPTSQIDNSPADLDIQTKGILAHTTKQWLLRLPPDTQSHLPLSIPQLLALCSWTYTIYQPLLLLPPTAFKPDPWPSLLKTSLSVHLPGLYSLICKNLQVSHIALNAPIPLSTSAAAKNILRSPTALTPLYGDFGTFSPPSSEAFTSALWVSARQHRVVQTWSPLYTMFSRGNISEKARILDLPEMKAKVLGRAPSESSAVDLYAGIGYFAFCYVKAGAGKVFCWEMNGWSVEGLRRGAEVNGWGVRVISEDQNFDYEEAGADEKLIVFQEDNRKAAPRIANIRSRIPPVRHVNCGFLPSSKDSWETAVKLLDPDEGGWVHVHENIAVIDIDNRKVQITEIFNSLVDQAGIHSQYGDITCHHFERVKSYAPGVMHCVLDMYVPPQISVRGMTEHQDTASRNV